jgi:hypothetical protein
VKTLEYVQLQFFSDDETRHHSKKARIQNRDLSYQEFVEKFKPKKTTDDCYTPKNVYDAVAEWTAKEYGLNISDFVRPFYPGGDYKGFDYSGGKIVVDNPPFSILSEIIKFYVSYGIRFLLFAPTLSGLVRYADYCTVFPTGVDIEYENGAVVATSFVTNLDPHSIRARTVPALYEAVTDANDENRKSKRVELPRYVYPTNVITSAQMYPFARYGIELVIPREESMRISTLDAQKKIGKAIFGCGWLISEKVKAEREKAEREKAEREKAEREKATVFDLSDEEMRLIEILNGRD